MLIISRPGYIRIGGRTRTSIDSTSPKRGRTSGGVGVGVDKQVCFGDRIPDPDLHSALLHSVRRRSSRDSVCFEGEILPIGRPGYFSIGSTRGRGRTSGGVDRQLCFGESIPDPDLRCARLHRARRRSSRVSRCGEGEILPIRRPVYIYIRIGRTRGGGGVERYLCFGDRIPDPDLHSVLLHSVRRRSSRVSRCGEGEILPIGRPVCICRGRIRTSGGGGVERHLCFGESIPDLDLRWARLHRARRRSSRVSRYGEGEILTIGRPVYIYILIGRIRVGGGVERHLCVGDRIPDPDLRCARLHGARRRSSRVSVYGEGEILTIVRPEDSISHRRGRVAVDRQVFIGGNVPDAQGARRLFLSKITRCGKGDELTIGRPGYISPGYISHRRGITMIDVRTMQACPPE